MATLRPIASPTPSPTGDIERLRARHGGSLEQEKARLRTAAKEFESLFMYQMLKCMRQTINESALAEGSPMSGSLGKDTFMDMFDAEMARELATGGNGSISEILYKSLEKQVTAEYEGSEKPVELKPLPITSQVREPMKISRPEIPVGCAGSRPVKISEEVLRPLPGRTVVTQPAMARVADPMPEKAAVNAPESASVRSVAEESQLVGRIVPRPVRVPQAPLPRDESAGNGRSDDPILRRFGKLIDEAATVHKVDSAVISAVIRTESGGNPQAVSSAGAKGLMQLMDSTAADLGVEDSFDARENVMSGTRYLRQLIDRFGDLKLALAAYNAGPGAVERHAGVPPYAETKAYVDRVLKSAADYRGTGQSVDAKGVSGANR